MRTISLLVVFLFAFTIHAQEVPRVKIPKDLRVGNMSPGVCAWACLETSGKVQGITAMDGLTSYRATRAAQHQDNGGRLDRVLNELKERKVACVYREPGVLDFDFVEQQIALGRSVTIAVKGYPAPGDEHCVLITRLSKDDCYWIEPNNTNEWRTPNAWLRQHWNGWAVALENPLPEPVKTQPAPSVPDGPKQLPAVKSSAASQPVVIQSYAPKLPSVLYLPPGISDAAASRLLAAMSISRQACLDVLRGPDFELTEQESLEAVSRWWANKR